MCKCVRGVSSGRVQVMENGKNNEPFEQFFLDYEKALNELGWRPGISIEERLRMTLNGQLVPRRGRVN